MLLCRFSHVEGCSQNALCRIMQRSAVCVFTWAICGRGKAKPLQVQRKWPCPVKSGFLRTFGTLCIFLASNRPTYAADLRLVPSSHKAQNLHLGYRYLYKDQN
ncbi:hypothetical protein AVEN_239063-1 [Araneus ventricosus]|uniref:Uncharacterized protein n=1 Tax=Araneus ventricosus TaxID=182803 RepID=A0A4Y2ILT5_ARAVE|nr:hypothetical protein AVEN_239063-1 [Araneus ventricosus]